MSRPQLSAITTSQEAQPSKTGMPAGGHGLAMLAGLRDLPRHADPATARRMMGSLQAFSAQLPADESEADRTKEAISYLSTPAPGKWIAGRVATLLSHYFVAQQEASIVEAVAEDWCAMLEVYPAWALSNASRWWLSHENLRKNCKPLPGDIQARAHAEMEALRAAEITVRRGVARLPKLAVVAAPNPEGWNTPEAIAHRQRVSAEAMARFRSDRPAAE